MNQVGIQTAKGHISNSSSSLNQTLTEQELLRFAQLMQDHVAKQQSAFIGFLQDESGLKMMKRSSCPVRVLLISPKQLKRHLYNNPNDQSMSGLIYTPEGQAKSIAQLLLNLGFDDQQMSSMVHCLVKWFQHELNTIENQSMLTYLDTPSSERTASELSWMRINEQYDHDFIDELPDELAYLKKLLDSDEAFQFNQDSLQNLFAQVADLFGHLDKQLDSDELEPDSEVVDPLGIYRSHPFYDPHQDSKTSILQAQAEIKIYALKIAYCAQRLKTSLLGLTTKVLVHEWAHWVTHLGLDSDLQIWQDFIYANKLMIEGSAQDLTLRTLERAINPLCCHSRVRRRHALLALLAFYQLNMKQSTPYRIHQNWSSFGKQTRRDAFVSFRYYGLKHNLSPTQELDLYEELLKEFRSFKTSGRQGDHTIPF